jgi:glycosyltransferase involved in cell wall biosynthesis
MKKILFYNSNQAWGGGEKWHFNMAMHLKEKGYATTIACFPAGLLEQKSKKNQQDYFSFKSSNLSFSNPFTLFSFYKKLKSYSPDVIFLNLPRDVKVCAILKFFFPKVKLIYRRGMPHPIKNNWLNRFSMAKLDIIIANSLEIKRSVIKHIPQLEDKIKIVYNGVSPIVNECLPHQKIVRLGNLGRLVEQKGQKHLIELALKLKHKKIPFNLKIAGTGPLQQELESLILKNNLANEVSLVGFKNAEDFFPSIDVFIFTSYFEGSANAIIESFQYAKPVIAFNLSSNPEVVEDNVNGFLIKPFDIDTMVLKIEKLISSDSLYHDFQLNCQKTILKKFRYADKVSQVENIINEL